MNAASNQPAVMRDFCEYFSHLEFDSLPASAVHAARRGLLDWLGCACAGAAHPTVEKVIDLMSEVGGRPQSTVIGRSVKLGLLDAPLVNGQMAHVLDYDDTYMAGTVLHASSAILPALLALAERERSSGRQLIVAYVAGFEAAVRVGRAAPDHHERGWHPTGTLGVIGAGVAAAKLLALDGKRLAHALGIAATQSAGLAANRGTMCKSFHAGRAASNGLLAALLAARDFDSAAELLAGADGYCATYGAAHRTERLCDALGSAWAIEANGHKPYPCAIGLHPIIDAMLDIRKAMAGSPADIERIELYVSPYVARYRAHDEPDSALRAKFSIPHSAAVALFDGGAGLAQYFDARVQDAAVATARRKVSITIDDNLLADQASARVTAGGRVFDARVVHATGGECNPMSDTALQDKFIANAAGLIGEERALVIAAKVWGLEQMENAGEIAGVFSTGG